MATVLAAVLVLAAALRLSLSASEIRDITESASIFAYRPYWRGSRKRHCG
jgi:hypothetical protein